MSRLPIIPFPGPRQPVPEGVTQPRSQRLVEEIQSLFGLVTRVGVASQRLGAAEIQGEMRVAGAKTQQYLLQQRARAAEIDLNTARGRQQIQKLDLQYQELQRDLAELEKLDALNFEALRENLSGEELAEFNQQFPLSHDPIKQILYSQAIGKNLWRQHQSEFAEFLGTVMQNSDATDIADILTNDNIDNFVAPRLQGLDAYSAMAYAGSAYQEVRRRRQEFELGRIQRAQGDWQLKELDNARSDLDSLLNTPGGRGIDSESLIPKLQQTTTHLADRVGVPNWGLGDTIGMLYDEVDQFGSLRDAQILDRLLRSDPRTKHHATQRSDFRRLGTSAGRGGPYQRFLADHNREFDNRLGAVLRATQHPSASALGTTGTQWRESVRNQIEEFTGWVNSIGAEFEGTPVHQDITDHFADRLAKVHGVILKATAGVDQEAPKYDNLLSLTQTPMPQAGASVFKGAIIQPMMRGDIDDKTLIDAQLHWEQRLEANDDPLARVRSYEILFQRAGGDPRILFPEHPQLQAKFFADLEREAQRGETDLGIEEMESSGVYHAVRMFGSVVKQIGFRPAEAMLVQNAPNAAMLVVSEYVQWRNSPEWDPSTHGLMNPGESEVLAAGIRRWSDPNRKQSLGAIRTQVWTTMALRMGQTDFNAESASPNETLHLERSAALGAIMQLIPDWRSDRETLDAVRMLGMSILAGEKPLQDPTTGRPLDVRQFADDLEAAMMKAASQVIAGHGWEPVETDAGTFLVDPDELGLRNATARRTRRIPTPLIRLLPGQPGRMSGVPGGVLFPIMSAWADRQQDLKERYGNFPSLFSRETLLPLVDQPAEAGVRMIAGLPPGPTLQRQSLYEEWVRVHRNFFADINVNVPAVPLEKDKLAVTPEFIGQLISAVQRDPERVSKETRNQIARLSTMIGEAYLIPFQVQSGDGPTGRYEYAIWRTDEQGQREMWKFIDDPASQPIEFASDLNIMLERMVQDVRQEVRAR
jgi:hypothetical protein